MDARALLEHADVALAAIAPDWTVTEWSPGAARVTGVLPDQILGKNVWAAFPTAKGTLAERTLLDVLADGQTRSYIAPSRFPGLDGRLFEVRVSLGPRRHLILAFREARSDLAPESRAAHILSAFEEERRLYRRLFETLPTPALVLTLDGQILETNPPAVALLGATQATALHGRPLADWTGADRDPLAAALRKAAHSRQDLLLNIEFAGEPVHEIAATIVNIEPAGDAPKLLFLAPDANREASLQQKLVAADRLAQLGALVSGVAHELNNPLAAISAFAELLTHDAPTAGIRESADIIHQEADRAGRVVRTLLDFARQRPRRLEPVDIGEVAQRIVALQRSSLKRARIKATIEIPPTVPVVIGDTQELQQVLLNGLVNAIQAIEATGRPGTVTLRARRADGHVVVTIDDTGPGVPPELLERAFDPFFTTKGDAGTGLGLSISFGLVRGMGGRLWLENAEEGGARFVLELPADVGRVAGEAPAGARRAARPLSVLIVEDEAAVRRAVTLMAERLGHRVTPAAGLGEARRRLAEPGSAYDALLVDVHLDEAHTGFELFEDLLLQGRGAERHVVFTTGDSVSARTRDALARAERPVLKKPFKLDELREVLDRVGGA